jgi:hypothetical protein
MKFVKPLVALLRVLAGVPPVLNVAVNVANVIVRYFFDPRRLGSILRLER